MKRSIALASLLLAGSLLVAACTRGHAMATPETPTMSTTTNLGSTALIPPIDAAAPTTLQTATFALG